MGVAIFDRMQDGDHSGAEVRSHKSTSHHIQHVDTRYSSYLSKLQIKMSMRNLFMCDIVLFETSSLRTLTIFACFFPNTNFFTTLKRRRRRCCCLLPTLAENFVGNVCTLSMGNGHLFFLLYGRGGSSCRLGRVHELQAHRGRTAAHFAPQDGRIRHPESGRRVRHSEETHLNALDGGQSHGRHCHSFISACRFLFAAQLGVALLFMWARLVVTYILYLVLR